MRVSGHADWLNFRIRLLRIRAESNFSQVVLEGINAMQAAQKRLAPRGKSQSIPASITTGRVISYHSTWSAVSRTRNKLAIFTNEGTGTHGPRRSTYEIVQRRVYKRGPNEGKPYEVNITHPGIRGTKWWEKGATAGGEIAKSAFRRKVERMLREGI